MRSGYRAYDRSDPVAIKVRTAQNNSADFVGAVGGIQLPGRLGQSGRAFDQHFFAPSHMADTLGDLVLGTVDQFINNFAAQRQSD